MEPTNLLSVLEERSEYTALLHTLGVGKWTPMYVFLHVTLEINTAHNDHLENIHEEINIMVLFS